jgi:hypothetical protein
VNILVGAAQIILVDMLALATLAAETLASTSQTATAVLCVQVITGERRRDLETMVTDEKERALSAILGAEMFILASLCRSHGASIAHRLT